MNTATNEVEAYPLAWPNGRKRTPKQERKRAQFGKSVQREGFNWKTKRELTVTEARNRLIAEISKFTRAGQNWVINPDFVVVSTNLKTRTSDGLPILGQREPDDVGVAVYFRLRNVPHCLACDKWDRVADNIAGIALHLSYIRGMERSGVGDVEQAFAGFKALPPTELSLDDAIALASSMTGIVLASPVDSESLRRAESIGARKTSTQAATLSPLPVGVPTCVLDERLLAFKMLTESEIELMLSLDASPVSVPLGASLALKARFRRVRKRFGIFEMDRRVA